MKQVKVKQLRSSRSQMNIRRNNVSKTSLVKSCENGGSMIDQPLPKQLETTRISARHRSEKCRRHRDLGALSFGHGILPCSEAKALEPRGENRPGLVQISGRRPARWLHESAARSGLAFRDGEPPRSQSVSLQLYPGLSLVLMLTSSHPSLTRLTIRTSAILLFIFLHTIALRSFQSV